MGKVVIYTDGACEPNPGAGGWACILLFIDTKGTIIAERELSGGVPSTTNNRVEITAVLKGLQILTRPSIVAIYSDSKYVVDGIGSWLDGEPRSGHVGWMVGWQRKGWTRKDGELKNVDLWKTALAEVKRHRCVTMTWVKGHNGDYYNGRCDTLAVEARLSLDSQRNGLQPDGDDQPAHPPWSLDGPIDYCI